MTFMIDPAVLARSSSKINAQMLEALEKIVRGCEAVLLDAALADEPVSRDVLLSVLTDARNGLRDAK